MKTIVTTLCAAALVAAASDPPDVRTGTAGTWKVDPVHSSVVFKIKHAEIAWFYGTLAVKKGSLSFDPERAADGSVEIVIDAASVATRAKGRDEHVSGPDFLDSKQFPEITFASKKLQKAGDALAIDGELTMRGVTKPLKVTAQKTGEGDFRGPRVGYEVTFAVKRSDFGIDYGLAKKQLGDEVTLTVSLELTQDGGGGGR